MFAQKPSYPWPAVATALPPPHIGAPAPSRRRKLWELEEKHHCPLVGTCVTMPELRRLARRFDLGSPAADDFALHVAAVNRCHQREPFAEAVHKHLEQKFALTVKRFEQAQEDTAVREFWRASLARGEVAAALWATMSHRHASATTRHLAYADIHMLSHQVGAGQAADMRRLAWLEAAHREQEHLLRDERVQAERRSRELLVRLAEREAQLARSGAIAAESEQLRTRLASFESGAAALEQERRLGELSRLVDHLRAENQRLQEVDHALGATRALLRDSEAARDRLAEEAEALEQLLLAAPTLGADDEHNRCLNDCPLPLAARGGPRCVLCVGGRASLVGHYRNLAERLGIRLLHHDGGQEEALSRLPDLIAGSDAVICPTDAVSHAAYFHVKQQCQRKGKPCLLFKGAGVSSFALAIRQVHAGATTL